MCADWLKLAFLWLDRDRTSMSAVDIIMVQVKRIIFHFDDQSKQVVSLFLMAVFSKRNRKHVLCVSIEL